MKYLLTLIGCWTLAAVAMTGETSAGETSAEQAQLESAGGRIDYNRQVAPILAQHCLECHGPDAKRREAGLRLDTQKGATSRLESGSTAIVAGDPSRSMLVQRITSKGDDRMPPADHGKPLTALQSQVLISWIKQGASWGKHWSFVAPRRPRLPSVRNTAWTRGAIDRLILKQLEDAGLGPLPEADRRRLIRRVYYDLLGLPPTPAQISSFLQDRRPQAWQRLVDRLLASPQYGQRWGRHWLDVARYGDSNGGDENHAYPLAWHYRDYVIRAFNSDLPYDAFVHEQLAGDLLPSSSDSSDQHRFPTRQADRVTATGFLALGTKILAERDKVKMRADLVDEQIDTISKSFLALTLACARCHDHKFDPLPTTDYYALAGILHSTRLGDVAIESSDWRRQQANHAERRRSLDAEKRRLQDQLSSNVGGMLERQAEKFDRGNVSAINDGYGKGIGIISDPGSQKNFAEYDLPIAKAGRYLIQLRYAALQARPGRLLLNGTVAREKAINQVTGGWMPQHQRWFSEGIHELRPGKNLLRIESAPLMSHIDRIRLIPVDGQTNVDALLKRMDEIDAVLARIDREKPQPLRVMAASEGQIKNVRVHLRGSHLSLGDEVARGFPSIVSTRRNEVSGKQSGRLELARWMTDQGSGAGGQTARVIANRIWHWHFGRGIVGTPNDFGIRGRRPTHPELLDFLAVELIDSNWSIKSLHRRILLSSTYRQKSTTNPHPLYRGVARRRLEAESIRDSLLFHSGHLDESLVGKPIAVKSQDPSPADLHRNEEMYRRLRRRSVYLPVVRSNVHRFLTLFDFPNAATPVGRRDTTTVPTQALLLMNDPFVMQQAEQMAARVLREGSLDSDGSRISALYERLFGRLPTPRQKQASLDFLLEYHQLSSPAKARPIDAWAALTHTFLSSNEFIYVE